MKNTYQVAMVMVTAALCAALLLAPAPGLGQTPAPATARDQAVRAQRLAEQLERNARVLTVFDRQGKVLSTVGERAIYRDPVFSPDRTRLAVVKLDLESDTEDLWVLDVASGKSTRITSNQTRARNRHPVWSPDGSQVAYVTFGSGYFSLYRKASNGEGTEELLYQNPADAGGWSIGDWSMDGRFLSSSTADGTGYALPLAGDGERKPIEVFRSKLRVGGSSFSPDSRFLAYNASNQSGQTELYVRPFDPSAGAGATAAAGPWQVSNQGAQGAANWRRDGKEIHYVAADGGVMVVEVSTASTFKFGKPKLLFRPPQEVPVAWFLINVSRDGQRVVIAVPHAPTLH